MISGAGRQIRRAKSASSVPRHRQAPSMSEQLDPEIAKRHAMAAASRAMQRASERSSNESRGSWEYAGGAEKVRNEAPPLYILLDLQWMITLDVHAWWIAICITDGQQYRRGLFHCCRSTPYRRVSGNRWRRLFCSLFVSAIA